MMKLFVLILAVLIAVPSFGQRKKKEDEEQTENVIPEYLEGVIYSLPQTGISVHVVAKKTDFMPGPYAAYASQLLGVNDARTKAVSTWEIESVAFGSFSEPDPNQVFKAMGDVASLIALTPDGRLAGINTSIVAENEIKPDFHPVSFPGNVGRVSFSNLSDQPFYTSGDSTNRFRATRVGVEQKAAEVAARILECRSMQFEMAAGYLDVFPPDGKGYEVSMQKLESLEKEYLTLFTGKENTGTYRFSFDYIPQANITKGEVIFRFSEENGVLEKSDLSGKPVLIEVVKSAGLVNNYERLRPSENPEAGASGVFYRQPGMAEVKLVYELKTLTAIRTPVAQFGGIAPLPETFLDGSYSIEFHPETGAIKNIVYRSEKL